MNVWIIINNLLMYVLKKKRTDISFGIMSNRVNLDRLFFNRKMRFKTGLNTHLSKFD